eukprot:1416022-Amphidinium_carterae.1
MAANHSFAIANETQNPQHCNPSLADPRPPNSNMSKGNVPKKSDSSAVWELFLTFWNLGCSCAGNQAVPYWSISSACSRDCLHCGFHFLELISASEYH